MKKACKINKGFSKGEKRAQKEKGGKRRQNNPSNKELARTCTEEREIALKERKGNVPQKRHLYPGGLIKEFMGEKGDSKRTGEVFAIKKENSVPFGGHRDLVKKRGELGGKGRQAKKKER